MSVELWWNDTNDLECDYGVIEYGDPRPDRAEVGPLMLVTDDYLLELMFEPQPRSAHEGALHQVTTADGRLFAHVYHGGGHWVWELFNAHFQDGQGPGIHVGRWPD